MYKNFTKHSDVPLGYVSKIWLIMRLTTVILIATFLQVSASGFGQKITLSKTNAPLKTIFKELRNQSGYVFLCTENQLKVARPVNINVNGQDFQDVLKQIFENQPLTYSINEKTITIKEKEQSFFQNLIARWLAIDVKGKITDSLGTPLAGASVRVLDPAGKRIGGQAQTGSQGEFLLKNIPEDALIEVSYIGYLTRKIPVKEDLGIVVLKVNPGKLAEVEVTYNTGYQEIPKERATGSFVSLGKELIDRKVSTNILDRLEDVTPGLIFNRGPQKGNDPISIRGRSTIYANTSPLIIVDNFPYDGPLENINPNDVESISVLKDAAAASIWGARAGNGVIVITTKRGKNNQPLQVSVNSNVTVAEHRDLFYVPQMSIPDFINIEKDLFGRNYYSSSENNANKPKLPPAVETLIALRDGKITAQEADASMNLFSKSDIRNYIRDYYLQKGINQQYALSISGGSASHAYQVSLGFDNIRPDVVGNGNNRLTLSIGDHWKTLSDRLEIGLSINMSNQNTHTRTDIPGGYAYDRLADENGNPLAVANIYSTRYINTVTNNGLLDWTYVPLNEIGKKDYNTQAYDIRVNPSMQYSLTSDLKFGLFYQYWKNIRASRNRDPQELFYTRDQINKYTQVDAQGSFTYPVPMGDILSTAQSDAYSHTFRPQLSYAKELASKHYLNGIAGMEIRDLQGVSHSDRFYGYRDDMGSSLPVDMVTRYRYYYNPGQQATLLSGISHDGNTDRFVSYYANVGYDYRHRYFLNVSGRKDQANIFGVDANMRGVPLWSIGGAWILSEESFAKDRNMPFLKFRATFGYGGNVDKSLSSEVTAQYANFFSYDVLPQLRGAIIVNPPNPTLRWEKVKTSNLAIDVETKNGIFSGTAEYYSKYSEDLLGDYSLPASKGLTNFRGNFAKTLVRGVDLTLTGKPFRGNFSWTTTLNYSGLSEKVLDFEKIPTVTNLLGTAFSASPQPIVGKPLYGVYTYEWAGLDPKNGNPLGVLNGLPSSDYLAISSAATVENLQYHGSARPTSFGAFRNDFSYKGLTLSVNISYRLGYYYKRFSIDYFSLLRGGIGHGDFDKRWKKPGDEQSTQIPSLPATADSRQQNFYFNSAALIEKGDHIRLNDIRLSYTINKMKFPGLIFKSAQFYSYANNLGILWKASKDVLDPDYQTAALVRSFAIGMKLNF
ncbi:SusC/RagA family TonB-linked outer membrane protein [Pedobacter insulae]|uniref:TonB-linked outer membrane protein, SusC/RagA family n=1 Tax=Pedobacter insulae TaxID=414048 RepID=A0A1I3AP98_9SPHI|nr:SusC/RagA family TonB-linked outer membrane protein [Pedobacter insulae]SFH51171.1 TonB-linked outer membrane protein, SusC/RagA family [Pedobacter insulae]